MCLRVRLIWGACGAWLLEILLPLHCAGFLVVGVEGAVGEWMWDGMWVWTVLLVHVVRLVCVFGVCVCGSTCGCLCVFAGVFRRVWEGCDEPLGRARGSPLRVGVCGCAWVLFLVVYSLLSAGLRRRNLSEFCSKEVSIFALYCQMSLAH